MFFVNFVPEEGRWYCYAPTATGMQKIPVSMDATPFESFTRNAGRAGKRSSELRRSQLSALCYSESCETQFGEDHGVALDRLRADS